MYRDIHIDKDISPRREMFLALLPRWLVELPKGSLGKKARVLAARQVSKCSEEMELKQ